VTAAPQGLSDIVMLPRWRLLGSQEAGCGFATLSERFATWISVSNRNSSLGLAFPLLYVTHRGLQ